MRARAFLAGALAGLALAAAPASAHIQVEPELVAPEDPVLFEVLVPGERGVGTTEVELAIPEGVLPFSFEQTPGWARSTTKNPDQSLRSVVWKGELEPDGFIRFGFLAATPPEEGELQWKAIQTYADGQKVRWIGSPDSDEPAAITVVDGDAPRQNAGGEADDGAAAAPNEPAPAEVESGTAEESGDDDGSAGLAIAGLVVGGLGLLAGGTALARSRRG